MIIMTLNGIVLNEGTETQNCDFYMESRDGCRNPVFKTKLRAWDLIQEFLFSSPLMSHRKWVIRASQKYKDVWEEINPHTPPHWDNPEWERSVGPLDMTQGHAILEFIE